MSGSSYPFSRIISFLILSLRLTHNELSIYCALGCCLGFGFHILIFIHFITYYILASQIATHPGNVGVVEMQVVNYLA